MTKMTLKEITEARIYLLKQQQQIISLNGKNTNTLEYKDLELEIQDAIEQLEKLPVNPLDLKRIKGQEIIKDRFKVKKFGDGYVMIFGYRYGDEEQKLLGTYTEAAEWINQYLGLVTA